MTLGWGLHAIYMFNRFTLNHIGIHTGLFHIRGIELATRKQAQDGQYPIFGMMYGE